MSEILKVDGLRKSFGSGVDTLEILKDISFTLPQKGTLSIVGPSGSGKTTLLGLCAGLDSPTQGTVEVKGEDLGEMDEDKRARLRNRSIGFVFQDFQLMPTLTALENVMVPPELQGDKNARAIASDLLERVGLSERMGHYPTELSGGEKQRVAIARAFANSPDLLFADEPTGNLDTETGHTVEELLFEINREKGTALVLVTHDTELAERTENRIRLKGGRIVES